MNEAAAGTGYLSKAQRATFTSTVRQVSVGSNDTSRAKMMFRLMIEEGDGDTVHFFL